MSSVPTYAHATRPLLHKHERAKDNGKSPEHHHPEGRAVRQHEGGDLHARGGHVHEHFRVGEAVGRAQAVQICLRGQGQAGATKWSIKNKEQ